MVSPSRSVYSPHRRTRTAHHLSTSRCASTKDLGAFQSTTQREGWYSGIMCILLRTTSKRKGGSASVVKVIGSEWCQAHKYPLLLFRLWVQRITSTREIELDVIIHIAIYWIFRSQKPSSLENPGTCFSPDEQSVGYAIPDCQRTVNPGKMMSFQAAQARSRYSA